MSYKKQFLLKIALPTTLLLLVGCQTTPKSPTEMKDTLDELVIETEVLNHPKPLTQVPNFVQQELMEQSMTQAKSGLLSEKRLEVSALSVSAKDFFTAIVEGSSYSIAIHPDVSGTVSLNLSQVTLDEVFDVVQDIYGYEIHRNENVIQVFPAGIRTETIPLNYLFLKRYGSSNTKVNSGGVSENDPNSGNSNSGNSGNTRSSSNSSKSSSNSQSNTASGVQITTENESDFWKELQKTLVALIGTDGGRTVIASPQAGLVTVRALPNEIKVIKKFLKDTEQHLHRQVIIEAKIMEVTLNDDYQQGIRWDQVLSSVGSTNFTFGTVGNIAGNAISSAIGGTSTMSFTGTDFSGVIDLLQTQGNVQVLSSPRITATNNQKAIIKVGEDEYFVTGVSSTTTTGTSTTTTPEVTLTPFFSGISLDVTPQIDQNGNVILHVHPSVTIIEEQQKIIRIDGKESVLPLAQSRVRESDTVVRAKSGEIIVIGGLIETYKVDNESKTPLLGDIPLLGELFKSKSETMQKRELVILLKPIVIGQNTWKTQLEDARSLLKKWFPEDKI